MLRTLVLRFSDSEADTVSEHLKVIARSRSADAGVYWAWWRPQDENTKLAELEAFRALLEAGVVRVGLANTKEGKLYAAECVRVVFGANGSRIRSPEPRQTPQYYRSDRFPAWFKFTSIVALQQPEFEREFGPAPVGHETLFAVDESSSAAHASKHREIGPIAAPGEAIMHISDLHFGEYHGFPTTVDETAQFDPSLEEVIYSIALKSGNGQSRIGVIVVSGDLISRGNANGSGAVRVFLEGLCSRLAVPKTSVLIVPGNHDIYLKKSPYVTREYKERLPFVDFLRSFYGSDIKEIEGIFRYVTPSGKNLTFVGLNSVRPRSEALKEFGYVGHDRYEPLLRSVRESGRQPDEFRFAVFHHHVVLPPIKVWPMNEASDTITNALRPISVMLDAGPLVRDLQAAQIRFVLHGHHHYPFIAQAGFYDTGEPPVYIIGAGSAGAQRDQLEMAFSFNTIGIYTPQDRGLQIEVWQYNRASPADVNSRAFLSF